MEVTYLEDVKEALKAYYNDDIAEVVQEQQEDNNIDGAINADIVEDILNDRAWTDDAITGNGSGSYTFNSYQAAENIARYGDDLLDDLVAEGWTDYEELGHKLASGDWEWLDVSIRCFVLRQAIHEFTIEYLEEHNIEYF